MHACNPPAHDAGHAGFRSDLPLALPLLLACLGKQQGERLSGTALAAAMLMQSKRVWWPCKRGVKRGTRTSDVENVTHLWGCLVEHHNHQAHTWCTLALINSNHS
jgi:hypothetical protein